MPGQARYKYPVVQVANSRSEAFRTLPDMGRAAADGVRKAVLTMNDIATLLVTGGLRLVRRIGEEVD